MKFQKHFDCEVVADGGTYVMTTVRVVSGFVEWLRARMRHSELLSAAFEYDVKSLLISHASR